MKQRLSIFSSFSTIIVFVLFAIIGISVLPLIPLKLNPTSNLPSINISVSNYKISSNEIEEQITSSIEGAVATVSGIKSIQSQSNDGRGTVQLQFDKYVNIEEKRFEILSILRRIYPAFPKETAFPSVQIGSASGTEQNAVLQYNIISERDPVELADILEDFVVSELYGMSEIEDIQLTGYLPDVYEIQYDFQKMQSLGVSLNDLMTVIQKLNKRIFVGNETELGEEQKAIVVENTLSDPEVLKELEINNNDGKLLRLKDFAEIKRKSETPQLYYRVNGNNTLGFSITPNEKINQVAFANKVKKKITAFENALPSDIELLMVHDGTELIGTEIIKLIVCSLLTLLILFSFIYLISKDIKHVVILFISFLFTISIAFLFYYLLGIELNLFSFAGLTISFGMLLDDSIMMIEHLRCSKSKNIIRSIFASSLTTIVALCAIFFLDDETKLKLNHFAVVVIINLGLSSISSLFLIPALIDAIRPKSIHQDNLPLSRLRKVAAINKYYEKTISKVLPFKKIAFVVMALGFGLPVFLLPRHVESDGMLGKLYNTTIGSQAYQYKYKEIVERYLGGALYPFVNVVEHGKFDEEKKDTEITVTGQFPKGTKIEQVNEALMKLELYLKQFEELKTFFSYIDSPENGTIMIRFKEWAEKTDFPKRLVDRLSSYVIELGSAEWDIVGTDDSFSNNMRERSSANKIYLYGYNYEELKKYADIVKKRLEKEMRVESVHLSPRDKTFRTKKNEYQMSLNKDNIAKNDIPIQYILPEVQASTTDHQWIATLFDGNNPVELYMSSKQKDAYDIWMMKNDIFFTRTSAQKMMNFGGIEKQEMIEGIFKKNQQYQLVLDFDYIGDAKDGYELAENIVKSLNGNLNAGFSASLFPQRNIQYGNKNSKMPESMILLFAVICIYLICAVLFESFVLPFAVITMIPISFTGIFLAFSVFEYKFDQGGYASFFLLTGLTVNAVIYIINERNYLSKSCCKNVMESKRLYLKSFNRKITPIFYTIASTSLGLIPFLLMGTSEKFWFPLALGTISGLLFSLIGLLFILPLFFIKNKSTN